MKMSVATRKTIAVFLSILWICGTAVMTFISPFTETGNGYFGCWAALIGALSITIDAWPKFRKACRAEQLIAMLMLASSLVLAQTIMNCAKDEGFCTGLALWLIVCSIVSMLVCVFILFGPRATAVHRQFKFVALFLCVWWTAGTIFATFDYPYINTGNGYFGCWMAFGTSAMLMIDAWGLMGPGGMLQYASTITGGTPVDLILVTMASTVTLLASVVHCEEGECESLEAAAMMVSGLSLATCCAILICKGAGWASGRLAAAFPYVSAFLLALWLVGTGFMTFKQPFRHTGNGFFGSWVALIAAWSLTRQSFEVLKRAFEQIGSQGAEIACILLASATLLLQASIDCADESIECEEHWAWAVACGTVSLVACIIIIVKFQMLSRVFKWVTIAMFAWWSGAIGALTFAWPYTKSGNAYFACLFAFCAAGLLVCVEWNLIGNASRATPTASPAPKSAVAQPVGVGKAVGPVADPSHVVQQPTVVQAPVRFVPTHIQAIPTLLVKKTPQAKEVSAVKGESVV